MSGGLLGFIPSTTPAAADSCPTLAGTEYERPNDEREGGEPG